MINMLVKQWKKGCNHSDSLTAVNRKDQTFWQTELILSQSGLAALWGGEYPHAMTTSE